MALPSLYKRICSKILHCFRKILCFTRNNIFIIIVFTALSYGLTVCYLYSLIRVNLIKNHNINNSDDSVACHIPKLEPFDPKILPLISHPPKPLDCQKSSEFLLPILFNSSVDPYPHLLPVVPVQVFKDHMIKRCFYQNLKIVLPEEPELNSSVFSHKFLDKTNFPVSLEGSTKIPGDHQFIAVTCVKIETIKPKNDGEATYLFEVNRVIDMHTFVHKKSLDNDAYRNDVEKLNVIILGIDSVSRMDFLRNMPRTYEYLMDKLNAVEMKGYNKIGDNTLPNIGPLLTNLPAINRSRLPCENADRFYDDCPFIWNLYKKASYRTLFGEDEKRLALFNWDLKGFQRVPTDYYLRPFLVTAEKLIGHERRLFTNLCYGPRPAFQVLLDYMQKMTAVMGRLEKQPFFQFAWSSSVTHDIINGAQLMDDMLRDAMHWWNVNGYLNNTLFVLMSDHGVRWGDIHNHFQGKLEDRLPFMHVVMPPWFQRQYPKAYQNLRGNGERLITTVDLYQTLVDVLDLDNYITSNEDDDIDGDSLDENDFSKEKDDDELFTGISLFSPVPKDRTCKMAGIPEAYCTCNHRIRDISITDKLTIVAAEFALDALNTLIMKDFQEKCAELELLKILKIQQVSFGKDVKRDGTWEGYQLSFAAMPGNGTFDAFLMWDGYRNWTMSGVIERTNSYGNQSHCVGDKMVKLYCYCLDLIEGNKSS